MLKSFFIGIGNYLILCTLNYYKQLEHSSVLINQYRITIWILYRNIAWSTSRFICLG